MNWVITICQRLLSQLPRGYYSLIKGGNLIKGEMRNIHSIEKYTAAIK